MVVGTGAPRDVIGGIGALGAVGEAQGVAARVGGVRGGVGDVGDGAEAVFRHRDRVEELSDRRVRRLWQRRTVWAVADARTGRQSTGRTLARPVPASLTRTPAMRAFTPRLNCWPRLTPPGVTGVGWACSSRGNSASHRSPHNDFSPPPLTRAQTPPDRRARRRDAAGAA